MFNNIIDNKPLFDDLDFKNEKIKIIIDNININNLTNMLIYGSKGSGKTILIYTILAKIFNKNIYNLKKNEYNEDNKTFNYYTSEYHLEFDPLLYGTNDKIFISNYLKYYIQTKNILFDIPKIIYIKNADYLTEQTQMSLRRMIEINSNTSKFIFECSKLNHIISPLKSRFYLIKHFPPKIEHIKKYIIEKYNLDIDKVNDILNYSKKICRNPNLKIIFGLLNTNNLLKFEYINILNNLTNLINYNTKYNNIEKIREYINLLYVYQINSSIIINYIYYYIIDNFIFTNDFIYEFINITQQCDINILYGNKYQIHIELYIIGIIKLLYKYDIRKK